jgi:hypothetical protein
MPKLPAAVGDIPVRKCGRITKIPQEIVKPRV